MTKLVDLAGRKFGKLVVKYRVDDYVSPSGQHHAKWHCVCDCGKEVNVVAGRLLSGEKTSCGHDSHTQNLVDKRFGKLVVLRDTGERKAGNAVVWECKCDCGNLTRATTASLNAGNVKSCGHESLKALHKAVAKRVAETPGTNLTLLNDKKPVTNTSGEKNITIVYRNGRKRYRVAVMYKKHQYGGLRDTMEEAIELREKLRRKYWPNYPNKK